LPKQGHPCRGEVKAALERFVSLRRTRAASELTVRLAGQLAGHISGTLSSSVCTDVAIRDGVSSSSLVNTNDVNEVQGRVAVAMSSSVVDVCTVTVHADTAGTRQQEVSSHEAATQCVAVQYDGRQEQLRLVEMGQNACSVRRVKRT
jgi:hypothetical protein